MNCPHCGVAGAEPGKTHDVCGEMVPADYKEPPKPKVDDGPTKTEKGNVEGLEKGNMVTCSTCGEKRPANAELCPHCGMK